MYPSRLWRVNFVKNYAATKILSFFLFKHNGNNFIWGAGEPAVKPRQSGTGHRTYLFNKYKNE
jgi:hypothetical protein